MKHIICGDSASGSLARHLGSRQGLIVLLDTLNIGPLRRLDRGPGDFVDARVHFWKNNGFGWMHEYIAQGYHRVLEQIATADDDFTIWMSAGMLDQFMWAWLSHVFAYYRIAWDRVRVKHIFKPPGKDYPYMSMGVVRAEQFPLCEDFPVKDKHIAALKEAYIALSVSDPTKLLGLCSRADFPLPALQRALKLYLKLYPNHVTGLSILDKALLTACRETPLKSARVVGHAMCFQEYEDQFFAGDLYLFNRLASLAHFQSRHPLVIFRGSPLQWHSMRYTEVSLTPLGKDVLSGKQNQIELNGIDEEIGGVKLNSRDETAGWFYNGQTLVQK